MVKGLPFCTEDLSHDYVWQKVYQVSFNADQLEKDMRVNPWCFPYVIASKLCLRNTQLCNALYIRCGEFGM